MDTNKQTKKDVVSHALLIPGLLNMFIVTDISSYLWSGPHIQSVVGFMPLLRPSSSIAWQVGSMACSIHSASMLLVETVDDFSLPVAQMALQA